MKALQKGIASVLFYVISAALIFYASFRSLHFITSTLAVQDQMIGFLALAATSGGMIAWLMIFLHKAEGLGQKVTAALMIFIDLGGEIALFTFDTLYTAGKNGLTSSLLPNEIRTVVLVLSGLVAVNIVATVLFHIVEPENARKMREGFVRDHLEGEALKQIEKHGEEIARELAPVLAQQWRDEFTAKFSSLQSLGLGTVNEKQKQKEPVPVVPIFKKQDAPKLEATPIIPLSVTPQVRTNGNGHHE